MADPAVSVKREWSDLDLNEMNWHDVHIHGMAAIPERFELRFDIDHILELTCSASHLAGHSFGLRLRLGFFRMRAKSGAVSILNRGS
jgi:hypothetical protein